MGGQWADLHTPDGNTVAVNLDLVTCVERRTIPPPGGSEIHFAGGGVLSVRESIEEIWG